MKSFIRDRASNLFAIRRIKFSCLRVACALEGRRQNIIKVSRYLFRKLLNFAFIEVFLRCDFFTFKSELSTQEQYFPIVSGPHLATKGDANGYFKLFNEPFLEGFRLEHRETEKLFFNAFCVQDSTQ